MKKFSIKKMPLAAAVIASLLAIGCSGQIDEYLEPLDERADDMTCFAQITPHDNLGSALVHVKLENLKAPHEIHPRASHYVLWAESATGQVDNLGKLRFNSGRDAQLLGVTKYESFALFVTAEEQADTPKPKGAALLKSDTIAIK